MVVKIFVVYYQSYEFSTDLEVEDMGFMVGKSSTEPGLKLHLLHVCAVSNAAVVSRRENLSGVGVVNRARTMSKLFIYCNYSIIFNDLLYW